MPHRAAATRSKPKSKSKSAADESRTKARLIEAAGHLFAERGADRVTGKQICARADVNAASINYHFGSFDALRAAVLIEAHHRLASFESLREVIAHAHGPDAKLAAVLHLIVATLTGPVAHSWVVRVLAQEFAAPSAAFEVLRKQEALPKISLIRALIADLMGLPVEHPAVSRGCLSVIGPCAMLLLVDRGSLKRVFQVSVTPADADALARHLTQVAVAGLRAAAREIKKD